MKLSRSLKQLIIGLVYGAIVLLIIGYSQYLSRVPETCNDAVKNQDELGVDCGGVCGACSDLSLSGEAELPVVQSLQSVGNTGLIELALTVANPNKSVGMSNMVLTGDVKLQDGGTKNWRTTTHLRPGETKLVLVNIYNTAPLQDAGAATVSDVEFATVPAAALGVQPILRSRKLSQDGNTVVVEGLVANTSALTIGSLYIKILLVDAEGKLVSTNQTELRNLEARSERDFRLEWKVETAVPLRATFEIDTNVFDANNIQKPEGAPALSF